MDINQNPEKKQRCFFSETAEIEKVK